MTSSRYLLGVDIGGSKIIFGGGTSKAGDPLLDRLRKRAEANAEIRARLLLAKLGSDSMLYGAPWGAENVADAR